MATEATGTGAGRQLAEAIAATRFAQLPAGTIHAVKRAVLDWLNANPDVRAYLERRSERVTVTDQAQVEQPRRLLTELKDAGYFRGQGGITVSESIRTAVKGKVSADFLDGGDQQVKNIAEPVQTFRLIPGPVSVQGTRATPVGRRRWRIPVIAAAVVVIVAIAGTGDSDFRQAVVRTAQASRTAGISADRRRARTGAYIIVRVGCKVSSGGS